MDAARSVLIGLTLLFVHAPPGAHLQPLAEYHSTSTGCNGDVDGIPCCDNGFILGDNDNGAEEMFIQAGDYKLSCLDSCKRLYKNSIGITESLKQKYSSGNGKNKNKCWCEFGNVKLDATNENYQTCVFAVPGSVVSPVAEPLKRPTDHVDERAAFRKSDKDGDGKLTSEEAVQFYKMTTHDPSIPATYFSVSLMDIFIDAGDENGNKMIDYDEVEWNDWNDDEYDPEELLTKEERETLARSALKTNDADGNGKLNMEELFKVFNVLFSQGGVFTRQQVANILSQQDQDGDGQLNFTEFVVPFMEV